MLAALCAVSSRAAVLSVVPEASLAPLGVPSLVLGGPSSMPALLSQTLAAQTTLVGAMPPAMIAPHLVALAASPVTVERAAAKIVAARLSAGTGPAAALPEVQALAKSAKEDPAFSQWFDGGVKTPSLELDGLTMKRGAWKSGGAYLGRLGQGEFGFVDVHPSVDGAVIKTVEHSASVAMFNFDPIEKTADGEEATANLLAKADAGPRFLGRAVHGRRLVSVRERVYGDTADDLMRAGKFGPDEKALVLELLRRLAAAGVHTNDLRPSNIMIGTTKLDHRRRAWIVDGGQPLELPAGTVDQRLEHIVNTPVMLRGRMDPNVGWVEFSKPWRIMFEEGLERWGRDTRWKRFKGFWKDLGAAMVP